VSTRTTETGTVLSLVPAAPGETPPAVLHATQRKAMDRLLASPPSQLRDVMEAAVRAAPVTDDLTITQALASVFVLGLADGTDEGYAAAMVAGGQLAVRAGVPL
jgi:hypothetical protein